MWKFYRWLKRWAKTSISKYKEEINLTFFTVKIQNLQKYQVVKVAKFLLHISFPDFADVLDPGITKVCSVCPPTTKRIRADSINLGEKLLCKWSAYFVIGWFIMFIWQYQRFRTLSFLKNPFLTFSDLPLLVWKAMGFLREEYACWHTWSEDW